MPKVGGKHYSYSTKGRKAAKRAAKRTGKKVSYGRKRKR
jgi:hypothetical protein